MHQEPIQSQSIYRELEHIDEALHRLKDRLVCISPVSGNYSTKNSILTRTGGVTRNKYSEKDILIWQRKVRNDWN
ncbi:hypothetical protein HY621_01495 [Candidatus Uhrbacteria bacterium]|nr:hypothetical protein [Candidatus Uhrbacteria bacterium]